MPDFLAVGHAVRDRTPGDFRLGGTVTFAAAQARALSLQTAVVTRTGPDLRLDQLLPGVALAGRPATATTEFENVYTPEGRVQRILAVAEPITADDIPHAWRAAPIVLLGPVFGEVPTTLAAAFAPGALVGVSAQGWLRARDAHGRVHHHPWQGEPYWTGASVLFASDEDLAGDESELARWRADVPIVAITRSTRGVRIFAGARAWTMDAYPATEADATGAGDTFATAFLVALHESTPPPTGAATNATATNRQGALEAAARFAAAAASLSVEAPSIDAIADRRTILARINAHPAIHLHPA